MKNTSLTALGGVITALSVFLMFLAGVIPNMTYVIPGMAALLLIVTVEETELKWSFFIYIAVSVLSFVIVTDKEAVIMYVFFFGYYPVFKKLTEKKLKKVPSLLVKFLVFNIMILLGYAVIIYIFLIPVEGLTVFGKYTPLILLAIGNLIFCIYDILLTNLTFLYNKNLKGQIQKMFHF